MCVGATAIDQDNEIMDSTLPRSPTLCEWCACEWCACEWLRVSGACESGASERLTSHSQKEPLLPSTALSRSDCFEENRGASGTFEEPGFWQIHFSTVDTVLPDGKTVA